MIKLELNQAQANVVLQALAVIARNNRDFAHVQTSPHTDIARSAHRRAQLADDVFAQLCDALRG